MHSDAPGSEHGAGEHAPACPPHRGFRAKSLLPLALPVGPVTAVNKGSAVHNTHILNLQDASGSPVATKLLNPADQVDLMFTIDQPGTYNCQCDVHPTEMKGTITVTPPNTSAGAGAQANGVG